ncbi:hypothetical protein L249_5561 [Ophiocordyceps polyrhachis-furcata BCC 54312]|uniref:2-(3-amino-3-carboxypropyl)histidine synthase subunit 2 n=1 Tax=Ophiocordyceps polyrhachis-furcata BCC 54312 TaxID=1330021 RepID=A0A367LGQ2_9HYPO|nr:hypothetical protein L249_5561 [Ophiocordyceps polyrhachis-furcata BCC 54312]
MTVPLTAPPQLSTPDDGALRQQPPAPAAATASRPRASSETLRTTYETARTAAEIHTGGWTCVALQFPDDMLGDAPRVVDLLRRELPPSARIHVLADTSYSACCVDEVAAEHVDADVVVHYGRACLSPTTRLPVIYVYTSHPLDHEAVFRKLERALDGGRGDQDKATVKAIVMADLMFQDHVDGLVRRLHAAGYDGVVATQVVRDPVAVIPNRKLPLRDDEKAAYSLFHLGDPPQSLLLALHSRFASLHVLATPAPGSASPPSRSIVVDNDAAARTAGLLRRRYARVLTLASAGVIGILVNTLSVGNYLSSLDLLRRKIAKAGKKSYTVVVGKLNPAKLANFAEIDGWVAVGCWESGLVEDDAAYWRPVVTPFELEVALTREDRRTWGGEWWGGIEKLRPLDDEGDDDSAASDDNKTETDEEESLPPEFDLRTGRLVSHSRPMRQGRRSGPHRAGDSTAVAMRCAGQIASIGGVASPGAEFLRAGRTWQGLGSDFDPEASTALVEVPLAPKN